MFKGESGTEAQYFSIRAVSLSNCATKARREQLLRAINESNGQQRADQFNEIDAISGRVRCIKLMREPCARRVGQSTRDGDERRFRRKSWEVFRQTRRDFRMARRAKEITSPTHGAREQ